MILNPYLIKKGGGSVSVPEKDVNFIDYDGSIIASYTAAEFADLTTLPANPTHDGLTAQGWNWSLADAKAYVASYGKLWVGQMYITSDGKTRIYIKLEDGRLAPHLGFGVNGTAAVDWGDGSATDTVTGEDTTTVISTQHTYAAAGDYVISISVTSGSIALAGNNSDGSQVLWGEASGAANRVYQSAIQRIEIGELCSIRPYAFFNCYNLVSVTIPHGVANISTYAFRFCFNLISITIPDGVSLLGSTYAFYACYRLTTVAIPNSVIGIPTYLFANCYNLASVTIPDSVTSITTNVFDTCYGLKSVTIPDSVTSIGNSAFRSCHTLLSVTIPDSVTSIGSAAFNSCYALLSIKFESNTSPTVSNSNAWGNLPTDCIIYVPRGSLSAYTSATNYPSSSTYTYVEYDP